MLNDVKEALARSNQFISVIAQLEKSEPGTAVDLWGVVGSLPALLGGLLHEKTGRSLLAIGRDAEASHRLRDDLTAGFGSDRVRFFGADRDAGHVAAEGDRDTTDIQTLRALMAREPGVIVTHPEALARRLPAPSALAGKVVSVRVGDQTTLETIIARLREFRFERNDFVQSPGDYALRGGILDVFPFTGDNPIRLELVGDSVESLREFDPLSQRSIRSLETAVIVPDLLDAGENAQPPASSLLDYLESNTLLFFDEPDIVEADLLARTQTGSDAHLPANELVEMFRLFHCIALHGLRGTASSAIDFAASAQTAINGNIARLRTVIAELLAAGLTVHVTSDTQAELHRLKELIAAPPAPLDGEDGAESETHEDLDMTRIVFSTDAIHAGFILPSSSIAIITEHQIFNRLKRQGRRRRAKFRGLTGKEIFELKKGDYIVHQDFGIGRFAGLQRITVRGVEHEVVKILYESNDTLFVNLNYLGKVQKYSSKEGHVPKLTRLGSAEWDRLKARTKKKVKDIARELIALYAKRKQSTGLSFPPDTPWQKELEASFMYEDTLDQAKATADIKKDMEAPHPMDRLVCGDVGFGKTEVAVRAAFKAVLGGKQAAVLVPTTILAVQHYNTFADRTSKYGVRVDSITRFKSRKEQIELLARLKAGSIDIVIGTHRLLSKDVAFKDLGLLVIDEEHRFGVTAKEKLRQMRVNVDTLSLTATPIPRTLHFSLLGARDLSVIATPPRNRRPVITEITQWNEQHLREVMVRELNRGGQIYFVHDRVQNIEEIAAKVRAIVPTAKIRVAHGQMQGHELEEVMVDFLEKRFDVLMATKIIESGLDIPSVNTIVINRADRFGMAELYQLRGRVGRSNAQAYATLLTPPVSLLPRQTLLRLQAVEEFTELGSGFNLAMRDLEIRGAGNLLGSEQSGFIESMGFETYTRILEEAVRELKEEEFRDLLEPGDTIRRTGAVVDIDFPAILPEDYIQSDGERLALYRRLYAIDNPLQLTEISAELQDRFGTLPEEVQNLLDAMKLRLQATDIGFAKVSVSEDGFDAEFPPNSATWFYEGESFQNMMTQISRMRNKGVSLRQQETSLKLIAKFLRSAEPRNPISETMAILQTISGG